MKKILIFITSLLLITGCDYDKLKISYIPVEDNGGMAGLTYRFTGFSESFGFQTGNVYYTDIKKQLLITNFILRNEDVKIETFTMYIYMNSKLYKEINFLGQDVLNITAEEFLNNIFITDFTIKSKDNETPFNKTDKSTFKDAIKISINYCYEGKCKTEDLELEYY